MNKKLSEFPLFDTHLHIVDARFPLVANQGYLPPTFTCADYLQRLKAYDLRGGAVVSGSFQAFDQTYLVDALHTLGQGFVGVTQLPATVTDEELHNLHRAGVRAVRFNVQRGGSQDIGQLDSFARRVYDLVGWHTELYIDSRALSALQSALAALPAVSIDHLGLSWEGFPTLLALAERGVRVKATGFGRVDFDVAQALRDLYAANPHALMFGADLPSTRAPRSYVDEDFLRVVDVLGVEAAHKVLFQNAVDFYRPA